MNWSQENYWVQIDLLFIVNNLFWTERETVHVKSMIQYAEQKCHQGVSKEIMDWAKYLRRFQKIVEDIHDVRIRDGQYELLIFWEGWLESKDRTWVPLNNLKDDIACVVED